MVITKNDPKLLRLSGEILRASQKLLNSNTNRMFMYLLLAEWVFAIGIAIFVSPYTWSGRERSLNYHVETALALGGILTGVPMLMLKLWPHAKETRYVVTIAQALWSSLLIHLTGGRIETHFHIFGSLAIIAIYRDWKLLIPATIVTAGDHLLRGIVSPGTIFGISQPETWRFLEHAGYVIFEDVFLIFACVQASKEMTISAERQAQLEIVRDSIQEEVDRKTAALVESSKQQETLQLELLQAQKLESVGRLASGIAHEINTPIQYITDSVCFAKEGVDDLFNLIDKLEQVDDLALTKEDKALIVARANSLAETAELSYLKENLPKALERSTDGLSRVAEIVKSMKMFAHPDQKEMSPSDLNSAISTTLVVCRSEYKYIADVEINLTDIPLVTCHPGEIHQVLINLIINAAHAISDNPTSSGGLGKICISSRSDGSNVILSIADSGCGIEEENISKIFEPFFTTKDVGRGTGQGLAIVHGAIVRTLGGTINVESEVGKGTTIHLTIPILQDTKEVAA